MNREEVLSMIEGVHMAANRTAKPLNLRIKELEKEAEQMHASASTLSGNINVLLFALKEQGIIVRPSANANGIWQDIEIEITNNKKEQ
jgi:hypothetical protein